MQKYEFCKVMFVAMLLSYSLDIICPVVQNISMVKKCGIIYGTIWVWLRNYLLSRYRLYLRPLNYIAMFFIVAVHCMEYHDKSVVACYILCIVLMVLLLWFTVCYSLFVFLSFFLFADSLLSDMRGVSCQCTHPTPLASLAVFMRFSVVDITCV